MAAVLAVSLLAACSHSGPEGADHGGATGTSSTAPLPTGEIAEAARALPQRTVAPMPATRLARGLTPPTNHWFSGLVFGDQPQPVFPLPLAFGLQAHGFGFGLPQVVASASSVVGSHQDDVTVSVSGSSDQVVSAYDDASVTISSRGSSGDTLGRTVVAEGSPFVTHVASADESLQTSVSWTPEQDFWTATTPTGTYGAVVEHGSVDQQTIRLDAGGSAVFFPVPKGHDASALASLAAPVTATHTSYDVGSETVTTSVQYGSGPSAFVAMPVQAAHLGDQVTCDLGSFPSVYGDLRLCSGSSLTWSVPRTRAAAGLDLSQVTGSNRARLAAQVTRDVASAPAPPADTYVGGKWLYRESQLLDIADQVGATKAAAAAQRRLGRTLTTWTNPHGCSDGKVRCFVYDPSWKGVVGLAPSFGSDQFNDHHFHYGYFLYAAGVLARHDPSVVARLRPVMNLLAADIAGGSDTGVTPRLRVYDVYAGHSWASGTSPFADGNNQESSSEAVNAWAGLSLWAAATGDQDLQRQAAWLLSSEAASARAYWTQPRTPAGFAHRTFGINWGGKRDYATWFSPAPSAILGIQLIPMSPSSSYLGGDPGRIRANVAEATAASGFTGPLGDYVLMYSALAGGADARRALARSRTLPAGAIDDGDSRSYLTAFLLSHL